MVLLSTPQTQLWRTSRHIPPVCKVRICRTAASTCVRRSATKLCNSEICSFRHSASTTGSTRLKSSRVMSSSPQTLTFQAFSNEKADACQHKEAKIISCASCEVPEGKGYLNRQGMSAMPLTFSAVLQSDVKVPLRLLCYGDSLTAGFFDNGQRFEPYGRTLAKMLRSLGVPCEVLVCGLSGLTAQEMLTKASKQALSDVVGSQGKGLHTILNDDDHFDAVLIMAGTNDLGCGNRAESIFEFVRSLHSICHACKIPTVALAPPSAKIAPLTWQQERHKLCDMLMGWASSSPWVVQATDVSEIVPIEGTERTSATLNLWDSDGLHFSPAGSQLLGAALAHQIKGITSTG